MKVKAWVDAGAVGNEILTDEETTMCVEETNALRKER
jgi:hypothetical protein